ncbi:MAG TPA: S8 family serine peptidase [Candidatus Binatia bacterium]|nr:S8 family serine peptidase [Candidatus Binatia bacterium]
MYFVQYGGKGGRKYSLQESESLIAVRTHSREAALGAPQEAAPLSPDSLAILSEFEPIAQFPIAGVEVFKARIERGPKKVRDNARRTLKKDNAVRFAGRVLVEPKSQAPVLYTENCFIKFQDDVKASEIKKLFKKYNFEAKRVLGYTRNAWFISAPEGIGLELFDLVAQFFKEDAVELLHPELIRRVAHKDAFPNQWHLKKTRIGTTDVNAHANVEAAWSLADGTGVTIAVIDDGVDLDHEEFRGSSKIIAPRDVTLGTNNPRPGFGNRHGTACAGVACADGNFSASGVAPKARLIPIRLASGLGSQQEADAFVWAAQNGADVISCSWGPEDGEWWNANDPLHNQVVPLPDSTRLAIDFAVNQGRNGKGCVVCFAAGNGNEAVGNDGYASYSKVLAIAACNDLSKKSAYSDFGDAVWCAFPSNEVVQPRLTTGIWTTDNMGPSGYNPGQTSKGDAAGNYTNSFGGTSSASPGAAGVAALVLSRNPNLRWDEVRELMKNCCDKIDTQAGNYDANGHSPQYGYGRLNAKRAVELAVPTQPPQDRIVTATATKDVSIRDFKTATLTVNVAETANLKDLKVTVDIEHTYIGDLVVSIRPPTATGIAPIVLHNNIGGGTDNLRATYDKISTPTLASLIGKSPQGTWTLVVKDTARLDQGRIRSVSLEMRL